MTAEGSQCSPCEHALNRLSTLGQSAAAIAGKQPGLPTQWTRVLERNPEANPDPLPGYVWLDTPGKVLHVESARFEFRSDPPA